MTQPGVTRSGYCARCYTEAIERLCDGFVILKPGGRSAVAVPPLHPDMAYIVRRTARTVLETRTGTGTARHAAHVRSTA